MKNVAASIAVALFAAPLGNELSFAPLQGATVAKRFTETCTWKLESIELVADGEPSPIPMPNMSGSAERELVVLDRYTTVDKGVATLLEREFEKVAGSSTLSFAVEQGSDDIEIPLAGSLQGARILFARADAKSTPTAKFAEGSSGDAKLLDGLREDLDLRALLPDHDVGVEDWWKTDAAKLVDLLRPGGELALLPKTNALPASPVLDPAEIVATTLCTLADNVDELGGEALLTWKETRKQGEREVAVIEVELEFTSRTDQGPALARRLSAAGEDTLRDDLALLMTCTSEGKGELVWDLGLDRCVSFEIALATRIDAQFSWSEEDSTIGYHFVLDAKNELSTTHGLK